MEKGWDGVFVIAQIVVVGVHQLCVVGFELKEHERDAIDEANNIWPAVIKLSHHLKLAHSEEFIFQRLVKIKHPQAF